MYLQRINFKIPCCPGTKTEDAHGVPPYPPPGVVAPVSGRGGEGPVGELLGGLGGALRPRHGLRPAGPCTTVTVRQTSLEQIVVLASFKY